MDIGITKENRAAVAERLKQLLADEMVLYVKTRNYHWNIESISFSELHEFYEKQYDEQADMIDEVAERIRMIGFISPGTMKDFLETTQLVEQDYTTDAKTQLTNLISDHETIIRSLRTYIEEFDELGDQGSSGFAEGLMEQHEKMRWMLNSFLPGN